MHSDLSRRLRPVFRLGFTAVFSRRLRPEIASELKLRLRIHFRRVLKPALGREIEPVLRSHLRGEFSPEFTPGVTHPFPVCFP
jgi:hypothetical protein